jgi:hypothetical protein
MMTFYRTLFTALLAFALLVGVQSAMAEVTAEEAAKLKTTLTPFGAERAGNAEGTIPAWTGGYTKVPEGYKNGDHRPDFFADEKPLYSITGKNMDQYKDKLPHGAQFLLKKHPDFRMDVYPTHRSYAAPQWVYDNTFKNATRAKLTESGEGVTGAYGGVAFPIPKKGLEAMWNHKLTWRGQGIEQRGQTMVVTADGKRVQATDAVNLIDYPYYDKEGSLETLDNCVYQLGEFTNVAPPYKAGEAIMDANCVDGSRPRGIWQYLVGQRRVRRAPSISYDTPDFVTSGIGFFDEGFMQYGPFFRHDYKLVGKKEMYIMYNCNRAATAKFKDLLSPNYLNPDHMRWELHRVWVLEATLKEGKRHAVPKRLYYIDEDSWNILMIDGWDAKGQLSRWCYTAPILAPDVPGILTFTNWGVFNLRTGSYFINLSSNESAYQYKIVKPKKPGYFSPNRLARRAR